MKYVSVLHAASTELKGEVLRIYDISKTLLLDATAKIFISLHGWYSINESITLKKNFLVYPSTDLTYNFVFAVGMNKLA